MGCGYLSGNHRTDTGTWDVTIRCLIPFGILLPIAILSLPGDSGGGEQDTVSCAVMTEKIRCHSPWLVSHHFRGNTLLRKNRFVEECEGEYR